VPLCVVVYAYCEVKLPDHFCASPQHRALNKTTTSLNYTSLKLAKPKTTVEDDFETEDHHSPPHEVWFCITANGYDYEGPNILNRAAISSRNSSHARYDTSEQVLSDIDGERPQYDFDGSSAPTPNHGGSRAERDTRFDPDIDKWTSEHGSSSLPASNSYLNTGGHEYGACGAHGCNCAASSSSAAQSFPNSSDHMEIFTPSPDAFARSDELYRSRIKNSSCLEKVVNDVPSGCATTPYHVLNANLSLSSIAALWA